MVFVYGTSKTSVSYGGQMARHMLHNGLKKAASSGDISKMNMYFNGADSVPILDPKSSDKFPIKQTKVEELSKGKTLIKKTDVSYIQVPHYDELSVKNIYPQFKKDPIVMSYFPDHYPANKGPPRDYFFNILNTLHPEYLQQVMAHANKQRMTSAGDDQRSQSIQISDYWEEQLKEMQDQMSGNDPQELLNNLFGGGKKNDDDD